MLTNGITEKIGEAALLRAFHCIRLVCALWKHAASIVFRLEILYRVSSAAPPTRYVVCVYCQTVVDSCRAAFIVELCVQSSKRSLSSTCHRQSWHGGLWRFSCWTTIDTRTTSVLLKLIARLISLPPCHPASASRSGRDSPPTRKTLR